MKRSEDPTVRGAAPDRAMRILTDTKNMRFFENKKGHGGKRLDR
jgi:hypothetical protein